MGARRGGGGARVYTSLLLVDHLIPQLLEGRETMRPADAPLALAMLRCAGWARFEDGDVGRVRPDV